MNLYTLAKEALLPIDLAKCSFMVLNRHSNGNNAKLCHDMQKGAKQHGIHTQDVVVASCIDPIEAQEKILLPVLDYMANHIQAIDDEYLNAKREELNVLRDEAEQKLQELVDTLERAGMGDSRSDTFEAIFELFANTENELGIYVEELNQECGDSDEDLQQALEIALENATKSNCGLPSVEELQSEFIQTQAWGIVFGYAMHTMRNELTRHFQTLDESLKQSVEDMKCRIVSIFRNGGLVQLAPACEDSEFLNVILDELGKKKNKFSELYQGFYYLVAFQLSFRNLFQYRLRDALSELYPSDATFVLPGGKQSELSADTVHGLLENALEKTLGDVEQALRPLLTEPSIARHAIAEEFRDRIWKARLAPKQWRIFLGERADDLWPEKFKWQELLAQAEKNLSNLTLG